MPEKQVLPDPGTPFGEAVHRRLRDEPVVWLTTVGANGTGARPPRGWHVMRQSISSSLSG
jgi:hypothetical protein